MQRGIELSSLDVSYFTSLSYYIVLLFGLRGVFSLVFRDDTVDDTEMMRRQMNPMANQMAFDAEAAFKTERTALPVVSLALPCLLVAGWAQGCGLQRLTL